MSQTVTEKPNMLKKFVKPCKPLNPGDSTQQVCLDLVKASEHFYIIKDANGFKQVANQSGGTLSSCPCVM